MPQQRNDRIRLTGLWAREGQYGTFYTVNASERFWYALKEAKARFGDDFEMVFTIWQDKTSDSGPDASLVAKEKWQGSGPKASGAGTGYRESPPTPGNVKYVSQSELDKQRSQKPADTITEDEVPF